MNRQTSRIIDPIVAAAVQRIDNNMDALELTPLTPYSLAWTASATPPTVGNSTTAGKYAVAGKMCYAEGIITIGSTGFVAGSGPYSVAVPRRFLSAHSLGCCQLVDASTGAYYPGVTVPNPSLDSIFFVVTNNVWGATHPVVPAAGDLLRFSLWYPWVV